MVTISMARSLMGAAKTPFTVSKKPNAVAENFIVMMMAMIAVRNCCKSCNAESTSDLDNTGFVSRR